MITNSKDFKIKGISVLNPVDVEKDYLDFTVRYAIEKEFNHFQLIGPIHHPVKGNIDGMTLYKKYKVFNSEKDKKYIKNCLEWVNPALKKLKAAKIKSYMWHHELEIPADFGSRYPQIVNEHGEIEITCPEIKDFLENKISDFFDAYPCFDGIILTLHETRVPLLKLKHQKLGKIERVKYITAILHDTCKKLGKELIVRPFASLEEDNILMLKAFEEISPDMVVMEKWTQFDWSLTMPDNPFLKQIKNNPLLIESDVFGEYFGKGRLPIMLDEHIKHKFEYCNSLSPVGYVARIDRAGRSPFGDVNEVNLEVNDALTHGKDADKAASDFFKNKYPLCPQEMYGIMSMTESILKRTIYLKGYYYSQQSMFPTLNHCKNHFYFEMMKDNFDICSGEWFIPENWNRGSMQSVFEEKESAVKDAKFALDKLLSLKEKIVPEEFNKLKVKFKNLLYTTKIWKALTFVFYNYVNYFENLENNDKKSKYLDGYKNALSELSALRETAIEDLHDEFYCMAGDSMGGSSKFDYIDSFIKEMNENFEAENKAFAELKKKNLTDFIVCGSADEGHKIKKEVNFSDTLIYNGEPCRICGNLKGADWSTVKAHGWFGYELKIKPDAYNTLNFTVGSLDGKIDMTINIEGTIIQINEKCKGKKTVPFVLLPSKKDRIYVRFDRLTEHTPLVYTVEVL